jgi:Fe(3+) dicitrate transport protein
LEQSRALALHALYALSVVDLTVTPGARVELIQSDSEDRMGGGTSHAFVAAFMPGVGAYYALTEALGVLAGVYRGFSPPPPGSADDVRPEYSVNYEAGARLSPGPHRVEVIGFYNDYSNLTDICTFSSSCVDGLDRQFSAGGARIYGLEAFARYGIPAGALRIPLTAAYTLTASEFRDTFDSTDPIYGSVQEGDELPYVPRHQVSLTLGVDSDWAGGAVAGYYVSRMREEAGAAPLREALATDAQTWLDGGAYVKPLEMHSIYGHLRNATGAADIVGRRPFGARPNAPRWLQVGAKLAF